MSDEKEKTLKYANITDRLMAGALDLAFLYFIITPITFYTVPLLIGDTDYISIAMTEVAKNHPEAANNDELMFRYLLAEHNEGFYKWTQQYLISAIYNISLIGIYVVFMIRRFGATIGKSIVGIKVVDNITHEKISLSQSVIRYITYIPAVFFFGIGIFWGGFNKKRRCWQDFAADSIVVYDYNSWYKRIIRKIRG